MDLKGGWRAPSLENRVVFSFCVCVSSNQSRCLVFERPSNSKLPFRLVETLDTRNGGGPQKEFLVAHAQNDRDKKKKIWLARLSVCGPCDGSGDGDFSQPNHGNLLSENDPVVKIQSFLYWKTVTAESRAQRSGLSARRAAAMADEDDDLVLRKYFGVHDKSLRELYTSTSSDATFYKLAEKIERRAAKSGKTVKHRVECWLRKLCQQVGASGLGSSVSLARP